MILLVAIVGSAVLAQTFNVVHYNAQGGFAIGQAVEATSDGYMVLSHQSGTDTVTQMAHRTWFDSMGNLAQEQPLHSVRHASHGYGDAVEKVPWGSGSVAIWNRFGGTQPDSCFLLRLSHEGDTLWSRLLGTDSTFGAMDLACVANGIIVTGEHNGSSFYLRTDTLGGILAGSVTGQVAAYSIAPAPLNGAYLSGRQIGNGLSNTGRLVRVDSLGAVLWVRTMPRTHGLWQGSIGLPDGGLICLGKWEHFMAGFDVYDTAMMYIARYDINGTLLWDHDGLEGKASSGLAQFHDAFLDTDSTFIACGAIQQLFWNRAVVQRFTLDGDTLWRRTYAHFANLSALYPEIPWDIEPTADGGMIIAGETWNEDTQPPWSDRHLWLLKLDGYGCLVPGCGTLGIVDMIIHSPVQLVISPNPTNGDFSVLIDRSSSEDPHGSYALSIVDQIGREVWHEELDRGTEMLEVDLSHQPSGAYLARLIDDGRPMGTAKFLIQR